MGKVFKGRIIVGLSNEKLIGMYSVMLKIRMFEERITILGTQGLVRGSFHTYIGQEAVAVGACAALKAEDCITSTHRGHGHCIAKGGKLNLMMAELMGKATGYSKGKGGSMHIADPGIGILGANGIVGGGIPIAVGAALAADYLKNGKVVVCFFGDGAANEGSLYESMNLASIWKLPVIFLCENNLYGMTTPASEVLAGGNVAERAKGFAIPGTVVDGNDVLAVHEKTAEAVERARSGDGPTLIEAKTYRWLGHWQGDPCSYRTEEEVDEWKAKDPIKRFRTWLIKDKILSEKEAEQLHRDTERLVDEAEKFAMESPEPEPETYLEDVTI